MRWVTVKVKGVEWCELRREWDSAESDIYILKELIECIELLERQSGLRKVRVIWRGGLFKEGWLPETYFN